MNSKVVSRKKLDFKDDPKYLSPPIIAEPLYQCATIVVVHSYVPNANIELELDGLTISAMIISSRT